jgi:predicted NUDIX family phosphoesterase
LSWIEEQLQENILSIPKQAVTNIFKGEKCITEETARDLVQAFSVNGEYGGRPNVEADSNRVQALPVVIVRNKSGDVLRLRRKEKREDNILHQKIVVWAGGHVRKEDAENGNSLLRCAVRELQEELRLNINCDKLRLLGGIYVNGGGSSAKHVAIVYEWRAETDDVAVALSSAEFFERQGTSLSGSFVSVDQLVQDSDAGKLPEEWSAQIVRNLLSKDATHPKSLFDS